MLNKKCNIFHYQHIHLPIATIDCTLEKKQLEVQGGQQLNASRPIAGDAHGINATVLAFNLGRAAWSINCLSICKHLLFFFHQSK
ncbi:MULTISPECIES: hypothetical protein [unclassified Undibacterium]|uniref:hypothetical protein n=1 Tax=unclassified Undibacterium TaxID=2630295 RepID=UPI003C2FD80A